ncbi:MAG: hypothetical protein KDD62_08510, partial [Bdellovibrionales bacterium]|nr:hypothetical protein [Bdellovibrionales bacterium]
SSFKHKGTEESVTLKPKASILAKLGKVFSSELQERCCYIHHYDSAVNQEFESAALKLADFDKNSVPFEMTEKEYHVHCDPVTGLSQLLERTVSSST